MKEQELRKMIREELLKEDNYNELLIDTLNYLVIQKNDTIEVVDNYVILGPNKYGKYVAFSIEAVGSPDYIESIIGIRPLN